MTRSRKALFVLAALLVCDQVVLYTLLRDDEFRGRRYAPFDPPLFSASQRRNLARFEDQHCRNGSELEIGQWCFTAHGINTLKCGDNFGIRYRFRVDADTLIEIANMRRCVATDRLAGF